MGKLSVAILAAVIGGLTAVGAIVYWFGWGLPIQGQASFVEPTRADYVDLLLTLTVVFVSAVGLAVTVGALVIGMVALKTLREIKEEAASEAKKAAAKKISDTMTAELEPNVNAKLLDTLPSALRAALIDDDLGHEILNEMAQRGELDEVLERVATRVQGGGPEYSEETDEDT